LYDVSEGAQCSAVAKEVRKPQIGVVRSAQDRGAELSQLKGREEKARKTRVLGLCDATKQ
jgi:hypothetical protein